jgi:hypothetical protein
MSDRARFLRIGSTFLQVMGWLMLALLLAWVVGAVVFDLPGGWMGQVLAALLIPGSVSAAIWWRPRWKAALAIALMGLAVWVGWLQLNPSNDRDWLPELAEEAWAEVNGDEVTVHQVRDFDYRSVTDFTSHWKTRTVKLSQITGMDIAITFWGSEIMAHPILSFQFADDSPLAFSIETRKEKGEAYSAVGGFYRQFELLYVAAEERDVMRLRTHIRKGENLFLYRTTLSAEQARQRFMEYVNAMNYLKEHPAWYNAITLNCTTAIRAQRAESRRMAWDWRILVNGKFDQLLYDRGMLEAQGLSFERLKRAAYVDPLQVPAVAGSDYSKAIRQGRPGFSTH